MARQHLVLNQNQTPIWIILDKAVLLRSVGSTDVMRNQYLRLLKLASTSNVTIQILPLAAGVFSGIPGSFTILQLPKPDPEVVLIEYRGGNLYLETTAEVALYSRFFDLIRATAKGPNDSEDHIRQLVK